MQLEEVSSHLYMLVSIDALSSLPLRLKPLTRAVSQPLDWSARWYLIVRQFVLLTPYRVVVSCCFTIPSLSVDWPYIPLLPCSLFGVLSFVFSFLWYLAFLAADWSRTVSAAPPYCSIVLLGPLTLLSSPKPFSDY